VEYIHALLQANPTLYLDELQEQLFAIRNKDVSLTTISHVIRRSAMTNKQASKTLYQKMLKEIETEGACYGSVWET
jgi:hypothetical protein